MSVLEQPISLLDGTPTTFGEIADGRVALVVNVASRCGHTPQYAQLQALHERYADAGFTVIGVPCNQFGEQEPGSAEDIATFCSTTYGVTFPMTEKVDVNGEDRHPAYEELVLLPVAGGEPGDVAWNFEKFLLDREGRPLARFTYKTQPDDPRVVQAVEYALDVG
jgi:glutathione peroxidase